MFLPLHKFFAVVYIDFSITGTDFAVTEIDCP